MLSYKVKNLILDGVGIAVGVATSGGNLVKGVFHAARAIGGIRSVRDILALKGQDPNAPRPCPRANEVFTKEKLLMDLAAFGVGFGAEFVIGSSNPIDAVFHGFEAVAALTIVRDIKAIKEQMPTCAQTPSCPNSSNRPTN